MSHSHHHEHHHEASANTFGRAFLIAIVANSVFVVFQLLFAYWSNSTSLFADAIHNLGDVFSLGVAWIGNRLLKRVPTKHATYGLKKASILAALTNVMILIFTCGVIAREAFARFFTPLPIETHDVIIVASLGVLVNAATAMLFWRDSRDLNIRAAFLHLASDAVVSLGVVVTALLIGLTQWMWLDPLTGLLIAALILKSTWSTFMDSLRLILDGVPRHISVDEVRTFLMTQSGVKAVHDLHIWAISTQENALSVHLWMPEETLSDEIREQLNAILLKKYHIHHTTIQVEKTQAHCQNMACKMYL